MITLKKDSVDEKILIALSELMRLGDTHITRYKIAKVAGIENSLVYKFFKNIKL